MVGLMNDVRKIPSRLTPVAMATKFDTKLTITQHVLYRSCPRSFRLIWVFGVEIESLNNINPDIILKDLKEQ